MPRKRKCPCGQWFTPWSTTQKACCLEGSLIVTEKAKEKKRRRENREAREKLKSRGDWLREAQAAFNAWIRERDKGESCTSCGRKTGAKMNAGHYRSVGSCPEIRFEELNCHIQCEHCNSFLSGNIIEYRKRLIEKIGLEKVEWLEGPHDPKRYRKEELIAIRDEYRRKLKDLKSDI